VNSGNIRNHFGYQPPVQDSAVVSGCPARFQRQANLLA
jgi:hypothetical protein